MVMPDRRRIVALLGDEVPPEGAQFRDWFVATFAAECPGAPGVFVLNRLMRYFGHQFLYDRELIGIALRKAGFVGVEFTETGKSAHPPFDGIDARARGPAALYNAFESMAVEARKS